MEREEEIKDERENKGVKRIMMRREGREDGREVTGKRRERIGK